MRRVFCFVMALVIMLSMACTAFAATSSGGHEGGSCEGGKHTYVDGKCTGCGHVCKHETTKDGKCTECGESVTTGGSGTGSTGTNTSPKTGDVMIVPYAAAMVSSAAALAFVYRKKDN